MFVAILGIRRGFMPAVTHRDRLAKTEGFRRRVVGRRGTAPV